MDLSGLRPCNPHTQQIGEGDEVVIRRKKLGPELARLTVNKHRSRKHGQAKGIIKFTIGKKSSVRDDL